MSVFFGHVAFEAMKSQLCGKVQVHKHVDKFKNTMWVHMAVLYQSRSVV